MLGGPVELGGAVMEGNVYIDGSPVCNLSALLSSKLLLQKRVQFFCVQVCDDSWDAKDAMVACRLSITLEIIFSLTKTSQDARLQHRHPSGWLQVCTNAMRSL